MQINLFDSCGEFNATIEQRKSYNLQADFASRILAKRIYIILDDYGVEQLYVTIQEKIVPEDDGSMVVDKIHTFLGFSFPLSTSATERYNQICNVLHLVPLRAVDNSFDLSLLDNKYLTRLWVLLKEHEIFNFPIAFILELRAKTYPRNYSSYELDVYNSIEGLIARNNFIEALEYAFLEQNKLQWEKRASDYMYFAASQVLESHNGQFIAISAFIKICTLVELRNNNFAPLAESKLAEFYLQRIAINSHSSEYTDDLKNYLRFAAPEAIRLRQGCGSIEFRSKFIQVAVNYIHNFGYEVTVPECINSEWLMRDYTKEKHILDSQLWSDINADIQRIVSQASLMDSLRSVASQQQDEIADRRTSDNKDNLVKRLRRI
jgi:hypothetical protein